MHPVVVDVPTPWGHLTLYSYGVALGAGLVASWYVARAVMRRRGRDADEIALPFLAATLAGALSAVGGGAIVEALRGGAPFALHGGAISGPFALGGALLAGAIAARRADADREHLAAAAAPCLGLIYAASAIGHYLHGTEFGRLLGSHAPNFVRSLGTFPRWELAGNWLGSPAYVHHLVAYPERMLGHDATSLPVHPVQLYDAAIGAVVAVIAYRAACAEKPVRHVLPLGAAALGLAHLATDGARFLAGGAPRLLLSAPQWLVVAVVIASIGTIARARRSLTA